MTIALGYEQFFTTAANQRLQYSGNNVYFAERFTCPQTVVVSGISINHRGINWTGSTWVGIQGNNAGVPDNTYISSGILLHGSTASGALGGTWLSTPIGMAQLNSGTIYHFVTYPSGTIGDGSMTSWGNMVSSGTNHNYARIVGSLFQTPVDPNFSNALSLDSGGTWSTSSFTGNQFSIIRLMFRESGALIGGIREWGKGPYTNVGTVTLENDGLAGMLFKMDKTYNISGVFALLGTIGNGSLWCRLEYSGTMVAGLRTEIGSVFFNQPLVQNAVNQTPEFYAEMHEGSSIYAWLYGSGVNVRRIISSSDPYLQASGTYGLESGIRINSTDGGSTVTFTPADEVSIYFAASGAVGAVTANNPYNIGNSFGGNFNYY